jgi:deoxyadenosine/deoxycytidine kinase
MPAVLISLEGNIGAGKSTLLRRIEALGLPNVVVMQEPVDTWLAPVLPPPGGTGARIGMLDAYYADRKGAALAFQMFAMLTRVRQIAEVSRRLADLSDDVIVITERCSGSDFELFGRPMRDAGLLTDAEWHAYGAWHDAMTDAAGPLVPAHMLRPSGVVYLRCEPTTCARRIASRARQSEADMDMAYLDMLHVAHEGYAEGVALPLLRLDGEVERGMEDSGGVEVGGDDDDDATAVVRWAKRIFLLHAQLRTP